jgi:hypothetical protein
VEDIRAILDKLTPEQQKEVEDFARFLLERKPKTQRQPSFSWKGGLSDVAINKPALDLQHDASKWMTNKRDS